MKILSDLFAVFLFFITYIITKDMIAATTVAVIVGIAQAALTFWKHRKLDTMQWVSLILIVFFGGATILLKDNRFIMWKPTVLFWIGAIVMLFSHLAGKNGLKAVMGKEMQLPDFVWTRLTYAWIGFLIFYGCGQPLCLYVFSRPMGQLQTVRHIGLHNHFFHRTGYVSDAFPV